MKLKSSKKKILLPVLGLLLAGALGAGIWFSTRGGGEPVNVYSFQYIGMTEFWGDAQESYGPVTTDKIQTEFLSETQKVTEVKVEEGDTVKKGDVLFSFDTTLDAISLERKRLDVEKIKVQIKAAEERLQDTREMVPHEPADPDAPEEEDPGEELDQLYKISENTVYDGSKPETALICWIQEGVPISDPVLQKLYETSLQYRQENAENQEEEKEEAEEENESSASAVPQSLYSLNFLAASEETEQTYQVPGFFTCNGETVTPDNILVGKDGYLIKDSYTYQGKTYWLESARAVNPNAVLENLTIEAYPQDDLYEQECWEALWKDGVEVNYIRDVSVIGNRLQDNQFVPMETDLRLEAGQDAVLLFYAQMASAPRNTKLEYSVTPEEGILEIAHQDGNLILSGKPEELTAAPVEYTVSAKYLFTDNHGHERAVEESLDFWVSVVPPDQEQAGEFYVVFKSTEKNFLNAPRTLWQGLQVTVYEDGSFGILPYDASAFADHTLPPPEEIEIDLPEIDPSTLYTAEQILDMQKQCYAAIKEQTEQLKIAEFEYQIMERELGDGNVYAEIDGKVISLLTEEEAREQKQPMVKVSGGGGFYVEGSVSELEKQNLKLGQEVTVNDWSNGGTYTGEVVSIGDFPTGEDSWNGMGNPTASYYPFRAFIEEDADLQAGSHVSISYSTASAQQGIYLEKPFIRTEQGKSYIFVRGEDGRLEKREVQLGKSLWGSYYEILSPLSEEDWLAFPYGKQVKDGAPTVESDISALYTY